MLSSRRTFISKTKPLVGPAKRAHRKYSRQRSALVSEIQGKGIRDLNVLNAIHDVPRHLFVDTALEHRAWEDSALPIGKGQTISQPYTVAAQTELLAIRPGEKILEIGTGSGYQAAILCELRTEVYTVERQEELYVKAKETLRQLGYRAHLKLGDGTIGWSAYAPYDAIVVTAGAPVVPEELVQQLSVRGRLVIPVGDQKAQKMVRITRVSEDSYEEEQFNHFKFVPLIGERGWKADDGH
ncbi:MAG: protein-L-isoaspartate(D-aspartate) O-methyltransferase [Balneolaceae bacterium]